METDSDTQSSDEEVFMGEITEKERQHPVFMSRRRTTLYFPGVSRPDSSIRVFQEVTDDGTLIFSCEDEQHVEMEQSSDKAKDNRSENCAIPTVAEKSAEDIVELAVNRAKNSGITISKQKQNKIQNASLDNLVMKQMNTNFESKEDFGADSDYCSVSDVSLTSSVVSSSLLTSAATESENRMEDNKCKRLQLVSPKVRTVQLQSPHLLLSPVAQYPDISDSDTGTHVMKRNLAHEAVSLPRAETMDSTASSPEHLLQSSESAFSKLQLKSPKPDAKFCPSAITKDFPSSSKPDNLNLISHENCPAESSAVSDTHWLLPPMKRKIAHLSPPGEHRTNSEFDADKRSKSCTGIDLSVSITCTNSSVCSIETENSPKCPTSDIICTLSESKEVSEESSGQGSECDRLVSAGGDAQSVKPLKAGLVFVPETPDIKSTVAKERADICNHSSQEIQREHDFDSADYIPPSQEAAQETNPLPKKSAASTSERAAPLSPLSSFMLNYNGKRKCRKVSTFKLNLSSPMFSPDLFSSPAGFFRSPLVQGKQSRSKPIRSPVYETSASDKLKSKARSRSESLQPIREDGSPVENHMPPSASSGNKENKAGECPPFSTLSSCKCQHSQDSVVECSSSSCLSVRSNASLVAEIKTCATGADEDAFSSESEPKVMTVTHSQWYHHSPPPGSVLQRAYPHVRYFQPEPTEDELEEESRAALTRVNTVINGTTRHQMLDPESSPALLTEFPAPKMATRVSWRESLTLEDSSTSLQTPTKSLVSTPSSILQQRPVDHEFPFSDDPPSPIVLTRKRLPRFPRLFSNDS